MSSQKAEVMALAELHMAIHARSQPIRRRLRQLMAMQVGGVGDSAEIAAEADQLMAENDALERELQAEVLAETGPDGRILDLPRLIASIQGRPLSGRP